MKVSSAKEFGLELKNNYGFECEYAEGILLGENKDDIKELIIIGNNLKKEMLDFIERVGLNPDWLNFYFKADNSIVLHCGGMLNIVINVPFDSIGSVDKFEKFVLKFNGVNVEYFDLRHNDLIKYNVLKGLISGIFA